jgi:hypothetical protein
MGVKWDISKEKFYNINWLSKLQLLVTYGVSGNLLNNGAAYTTAQYSPSSLPTLYPPNNAIVNPGNPDLTWEKDKMLNIGIDFAIGNNVLQGRLEYFSKQSSDLIGEEVIPSSAGFTNTTLNYGGMKGNGFDIALNSKNLTISDFQWTSSFLMSHATDKITNYNGGFAQNGILVGNSVNTLFAYKWAGLDPANGNPRGYDPVTGAISEDYGTLTAVTASQEQRIGSSVPLYFGGFRNTFSYKRFSLSANISYKLDYYFLRSSIDYGGLFSNWTGNIDYENRWQKPGDENHTNVPSMPSVANESISRDQFYLRSAALATKGDNIRLQDINLTYDIGRQSLGKTNIRDIKLSIYANNLGIIWRANKYGIDPDAGNSSFLNPKTVAFRLLASF